MAQDLSGNQLIPAKVLNDLESAVNNSNIGDLKNILERCFDYNQKKALIKFALESAAKFGNEKIKSYLLVMTDINSQKSEVENSELALRQKMVIKTSC